MTDYSHFYILLSAAFVLGTCIGSFVTSVSYRLPLGQEIVYTPSHCTSCNTPLKVRDLVPVLSWIWQRGRCSYCKAKVSRRYPLTELALGLGFAALFLAFGVSLKAFLLALMVTELAILIVTDLEHTMIPDSVQIALLFTGVGWRIIHNAHWDRVMMGAAIGLTLGLLLHYGYKYFRKKDGLGFADVKFLGVAGVWLPFHSFVPFLFIAGVLGTLTGLLWRALGRGPIFPFGPALAVSLCINVLWPNLLERLVL